jgi:hypothetical protein
MEPPRLKRLVCSPLNPPIRLGQQFCNDRSCPLINRHLEIYLEPILRSVARAAGEHEACPTGLNRIDFDLGDLDEVATGLV